MVKKGLTKTEIDQTTTYNIGECLKNKNDNNSYLICYVDADSLILLNIHDGSISKELRQHITKEKYEKISINPIVYKTFSKQTALGNILSDYPKSALDDIVDDYALQICINAVKRKYCNVKDINDYPAIIVAANENNTKNVVVDYNCEWDELTWNQDMINFINSKGFVIGSMGWKYKVGNCAEQHAANDLITLHPDTKIGDVVFSKAIRPRTGEKRPYCDNCCKIFGLKN